MTYLLDDKIRYDDSANIDSFGHLRVSISRLMGEYRFMYGDTSESEYNYYTSGSGTITSSDATTCKLLNLTTTTGEAVLQTKQYHPYITGTSNKALIGFKFDPPRSNLVQSAGLFDSLNGIFLRLAGTAVQFVIRRAGIDVEVINQSDWNIDKFDGSQSQNNPSGLLLDLTKCQMLFVDYQILGGGRARMGFVIDGQTYYANKSYHSNISTDEYIFQPSLPLRWSIRSSSTTTSATLKAYGGSVYCEGSDAESGFNRAISTDGSTISLTSSNSISGRGIIGIRLKNSLIGKPNRALARAKSLTVLSDQDIQYKLVILPGISSTTSTVTWNSVPGYGWCEYTTGFSLISNWADTATILEDQFATGSTNNKTGNAISTTIANRNSTIYQNYQSDDSQILAIVGFYLGNNATIRAGLTWIEIK